MKRWIILCLAFSSGLLSANAGSTVVKDSLLRIYVSAPHDSTRLDVLHDIARLDQQTPVFLYYENKLLQEATAQNNLRYQSLATYEHIIHFLQVFPCFLHILCADIVKGILGFYPHI